MTRTWFNRATLESTLEPGAPFRYVYEDEAKAVIGDIEVAEPPHRLVMRWRTVHDVTAAAEPRPDWSGPSPRSATA